MTRPVINIDELELRGWGHGGIPAATAGNSLPPEKYAAQIGPIAPRIGAQKLGYSLIVLASGKRGWPMHNHTVNEEMFFVIEGKGELRVGQESYPLRAGDVIACPPGGPDTAHQIVNTSDAELKYLAISTKMSPDVTDYPDSNKFGVLVELPPDADGKPRQMRFVGRRETAVGYWDGE